MIVLLKNPVGLLFALMNRQKVPYLHWIVAEWCWEHNPSGVVSDPKWVFIPTLQISEYHNILYIL